MKINYKKNTKKLLAYLMVLAIVFLFTSNSTAQNATVTTNGNAFIPDTITCTVGNIITFNLGAVHNAVEVAQGTYTNNGTTSNGGFSIPFNAPGSTFIPTSAQTYYYVCQPHVGAFSMKGVIIASAPATGSFSYSGSMPMGLCGNLTADITAYLNGCSSLTNDSVQYILTLLPSTILLDTTLVVDSIVLPPLGAGTYSLSALNLDNLCEAPANTFNVVASPAITVSSPFVQDNTGSPLCNGVISVTPSPPSPLYTFTWYTAGVVYSSPTQGTTSSLLSLCEDTYCLTIEDNVGCTYNDCYDVVFYPCSVSVEIEDTIQCYGDATGSIKASVDTNSLALGPDPFFGPRYIYRLFTTNPLTLPPLAVQPTDSLSFTFLNLPSNNYLVTVLDKSYGTLCSSDSLFLPQPDQILIYTSVDSSTFTWVNDGEIRIDSITGTQGSYTITWYDSSYANSPPPWNILQIGGDTLDSLFYSHQYYGGYTITVTDSLGGLDVCFEDSTIYVHPEIDSIAGGYGKAIDPTCHNDCDAQLFTQVYNIGTVNVPPFTFEWYSVDPSTGIETFLQADTSVGPAHFGIYDSLCVDVYAQYKVKVYDYYDTVMFDVDFELFEPDSMYVLLGPDFVIDCGEDTVLGSLVIGGNQFHDTVIIQNETLIWSSTNPDGFGDSLSEGKYYLLQVSGTYFDGVDSLDAAYNFFPNFPQTEVMDWSMDGSFGLRPDPNVYQPNHIYYFEFPPTGNSLDSVYHQWEILTSANFTGSLTFQLSQITFDTSIYTYSWTENPPGGIISDADTALAYPDTLASGTDYILTVLDANACPAVDTVNVSWDVYILEFGPGQPVITNVTCNGQSDGTISVMVDSSSGFTPYSYTWPELVPDSISGNSGLPLQFINQLPLPQLSVGNYVFRLQDSIGCRSLDTIVTITEPDSLYACGIDTALIAVLVDAFTMDFDTITGPYSYTTVNTDSVIEYKLVISGTYAQEWNNGPSGGGQLDNKDAAYYFDLTTNYALAYNDWRWNGDSTARPTPDVYNLTTHTYEYYFMGDNATQVFSYSDSTYLNNTGSLSFELYKMICSTTDTAYTCYGDSTGTDTIMIFDGTPRISTDTTAYTVLWTTTGAIGSAPWGGDTLNRYTAYVTGLPAGDYTATITDSLNCSYQRRLVVLEPQDSLQTDSLSHIDVLCKGDSAGEISAVVSGGFGHRFVMLTNVTTGDTIESFSGLNGITDSIHITGLPADTFLFHLFDTIPDGLYGIYGCEQITQIIITEPQDTLKPLINPSSDITCWGDSTGIAIASVIGGQYPYTYAWDNGETTHIADSLWAGWQGITFTDANGCTARDSIFISHLNDEILALNTLDFTNTVQIIQNVQCFNACDAIATLSTIGGVPPYTYFWDTAPTTNIIPDTAFNLCAGGHNIVVTDAAGCIEIVIFMVTEPDALSVTASGIGAPTGSTSFTANLYSVQCSGDANGRAKAIGSNGTTPYTYVWDSINGPEGDSIDNLAPGEHTVYVTDENGCTISDTVVITEPTELQVEIIDSLTVYPYCAFTSSGELCAIATGGIQNYTYQWDDPLLQQTPCAINLFPNIYPDGYTVMVIDDHNCITSTFRHLDSITNTMTTDGVHMTIVDASCFGYYDGSVTIDSVQGAFPPYTYTWTPAVAIDTAVISSLYAQSYSVVIEDSNGCTVTVNAEVEEPEELKYTTYNVIDETCFGVPGALGTCDGQIWVDVQGGTWPYYYDDSELGAFPIANANQVQLVNDSLIYDLCSGLHSIFITDDNNCTGAVIGTFQEFVDSGLVVDIPIVFPTSNANCFDSFDGVASVKFPANPLLTYTWETYPITTTIATGPSTSILSPGDYVLVAHYADSASFGQMYPACVATSTQFTIGSLSYINIAPLSIVSGVSCVNDTDGVINLIPSGGLGTYTYLWDTTASIPGSILADQDSLLPGTYTVTITDSIGCEITEALVIVNPPAITADFIVDPGCGGLNNGSITINSNGGTGIHMYSINGGLFQNPNIFTGLVGGVGITFTIVIQDANGCEYSEDVPMLDPPSVISSVEADPLYFGPFDVSCNGKSDASATAFGNGVSWQWDDPSSQITQKATGLSAGTYTVIATDVNGCFEPQTIVITEPDKLLANITWSQYSTVPYEVSCFGANDGWAKSSPTGGVGGINALDYNFVWKGSLGTISVTSFVDGLTANTAYTLTLTDANGCQDIATTPVFTEPARFDANVTFINYSGPTHAEFAIQFIDSTTVNVNHYWYWGDITDPEISQNSQGLPFVHTFTEIGVNNIYVLVENINTGCIDSIPFSIEVQGIPEIFNVFSPNNDGVNDYFSFGEYGMKNLDVQIFNRWGQEVYSWVGENKDWDGKGADGQNLPEGVYFFVFKADGIDGHYYDKKGSITIIR